MAPGPKADRLQGIMVGEGLPLDLQYFDLVEDWKVEDLPQRLNTSSLLDIKCWKHSKRKVGHLPVFSQTDPT